MKKSQIFSGLAVTVFFLALSTPAFGQTTLSILGDMDCFGTGAACVEDGSTWVPGLWGAESQDVGDPTWSDVASRGTVGWTHTFAPASPASAFLRIRTAGWADITTWDIFADAVMVAQVVSDGVGHILAETFSFALPVGLLADGSVAISMVPGSTSDLYAIDYAEIVAEGVAVPEPGLLLLMAIGMMGLGLKAVRRRGPIRV